LWAETIEYETVGVVRDEVVGEVEGGQHDGIAGSAVLAVTLWSIVALRRRTATSVQRSSDERPAEE
jgi:hypothetical protein